MPGTIRRTAQLLRGGFTNGRNAPHGLEHGRGLVARGRAARPNQRPKRRSALAALAAGFLRRKIKRRNRLAVEVGDDLTAMGAGAHVSGTGLPADKHGLPVKAHAHAHAPEDKELLPLGLHIQLLAQLDELQ